MRRALLLLALVSTAALADLAPPEPTAPAPAPAPEVAPTPAPAAPVHPEGIEKAMPTGVIQGGWSYVAGAWGVGLLGLVLYTVSLIVRRPRAGSTP